MKIDENYSLENDANNWILKYEREGDINPDTGKPIISTDKWYCSSLQSALTRYFNETTKPTKAVRELLLSVNTAMDSIKKLTKGL